MRAVSHDCHSLGVSKMGVRKMLLEPTS